MSQSLTKTWHFTQESYIAEHNLGGVGSTSEGVCISLSCRWAKMMLKSKKSLFSSPELTESQRTGYFSKSSVPQKIAINQQLFDEERDYARTEIRYAKESLKEVRRLFDQGDMSWGEYEILSGEIMKGAGDTAKASEISLQRILQSNKLHVVERQSCQSFSEYFLGTQPGSCYIFSSHLLEHAVAGYVSGGVISYDYYFFDPNSGEFIASGSSEIAMVMDRFKKHYVEQGYLASKADRLKVEYEK